MASPPRRTGWVTGAVVLALVAGGVTASFALGWVPGTTAAPTLMADPPASVAHEAPSVTALAIAETQAPPAPMVDAGPTVTFHVTPDDAQLVVDGTPVDTDTLPLPTGEQMHVVLVKAPGYVDRLLVVDAHSTPTLEIVLDAASDATADH